MSYVVAESDVQEDKKTKSMYLQLGFFVLLFMMLTMASNSTSAYAPSCSGTANLTGPLLPAVV